MKKITILPMTALITIMLALVGPISAMSLSTNEQQLLDLTKGNITWNNIATINTLIQQGTSPNIMDEKGYTPLFYACQDITRDSEATVQILLLQGADPNIIYQYDKTSYSGRTRAQFTLLQILLFDQSIIKEKYSQHPSNQLFLNVIALLLRYGANPNVKNLHYANETPLFFVARLKAQLADQLIETLVKYGANINAQNNKKNTALHVAIEENNEFAVRALVELGASTTIKNKKGKTPLDIAIETQSPLVSYLLPPPPEIN